VVLCGDCTATNLLFPQSHLRSRKPENKKEEAVILCRILYSRLQRLGQSMNQKKNVAVHSTTASGQKGIGDWSRLISRRAHIQATT
jgi:hypothetical protein